MFFTAPRIESRFRALLWADAVGLALFAVLGAEIALLAGARPWAAVLLGVVTATFGGVARDVICNEIPLLLRKEIYALAALAGAAAFVLLRVNGVWRDPALLAGMAVASASAPWRSGGAGRCRPTSRGRAGTIRTGSRPGAPSSRAGARPPGCAG